MVNNTEPLSFTTNKSDDESSVSDCIIKVVSSFLLFLSMGSFTLLFNVTLNFPVVIITAIFFITFYALTFPYKKRRVIAAAVPIMFIIIMFAFGFYYISNGFFITVNIVSEFIGAYYGIITPQYNVSCSMEEYTLSANIFFMLFAVVFSYITYHIVYRKNIALSIALLLFVACLFITFSKCVTAPLIMISLFPFAVFFLQCSRHNTNTASVIYTTVILIAISVSLSLFFIFAGKSNFLNISDNTVKIVDNIRYEKEKNNSLINGDFLALNSYEINDTRRLEVIMENPFPVYLRGYTGSIYTNKGWSEIENNKLYENSDLFYWLHKDNFFGQSQIALAVNCANKNIADNLSTVTVRNVNASSKYIYTPYEIYDNKLFDKDKIGDVNTLSKDFFGSRYYTYSILDEENINLKNIDKLFQDAEFNDEIKRYSADESAYRHYVYSNFTEIPKDVSNVLTLHLSGDKMEGQGHLDYSIAENEIRKALKNIEYTNSVSYTPDDDFLQDFLTVKAKGCHVHFATASALMFRYYGIPSRYVEGYRITDDDITGALSNSLIIVTDKNAYAWAEYYKDGIGWVPFEVNGYFDDKAENGSNQQTKNKNENAVLPDNTNSYQIQDDVINSASDNLSNMWFIVFIILILFVIIITYIAVGKIRLNRRIKKLNAYGEKQNIINTYAYIFKLLDAMNITINIVLIDNSLEIIKNKTSKKYFEDFKSSIPVFYEAKFSNHIITKEAEAQILTLKDSTISEIKQSLSLIKRIKLRFINFLY